MLNTCSEIYMLNNFKAHRQCAILYLSRARLRWKQMWWCSYQNSLSKVSSEGFFVLHKRKWSLLASCRIQQAVPCWSSSALDGTNLTNTFDSSKNKREYRIFHRNLRRCSNEWSTHSAAYYERYILVNPVDERFGEQLQKMLFSPSRPRSQHLRQAVLLKLFHVWDRHCFIGCFL